MCEIRSSLGQTAGRHTMNRHPGNGKMFVLPMNDCVRIRADERGNRRLGRD